MTLGKVWERAGIIVLDNAGGYWQRPANDSVVCQNFDVNDSAG